MGLFLCSHNPEVVEKAVFRDVRIIRPAREGFVPYRDYIGSVLELLDVASGRRQVVLSSAQPFEAPNWTRDGSALIYNTSGRVAETRGRFYRFDLATRQAAAHRHGLRQPQQQRPRALLRRHHARHQRPEHDGGRSTIFTLPVTGGSPSGSRPLAPSYLHGWSPDGQAPRLHRRTERRVRHLHGSPPTAAARRSSSPTARAWTTAPSTPPTGSTSTSTRSARRRCRSGG